MQENSRGKRKTGYKPIDRDIIKKDVFEYLDKHQDHGINKVAIGTHHGTSAVSPFYHLWHENQRAKKENEKLMAAKVVKKETEQSYLGQYL